LARYSGESRRYVWPSGEKRSVAAFGRGSEARSFGDSMGAEEIGHTRSILMIGGEGTVVLGRQGKVRPYDSGFGLDKAD